MTTRDPGPGPGVPAWTAAALCALALFAAPSAAELRCGSRLVSSGDRKIEVLRKCGHPVLVETRVDSGPVHLHVGHGLTHWVANREIEEWTYNFGPRRFMRLIRFANGRVVRIVSLDNGY